jgi:hypothetical protein
MKGGISQISISFCTTKIAQKLLRSKVVGMKWYKESLLIGQRRDEQINGETSRATERRAVDESRATERRAVDESRAEKITDLHITCSNIRYSTINHGEAY